MAFLILVISLLVFRLVDNREHLFRDQWMHRWREMVEKLLGEGSVASMLVVVLVPVSAIGVVDLWLDQHLWGILGFAFSLAVVIYCLGRNSCETDIDHFRELASKGDFEAVGKRAQEITQTHCGPEGCDTTQSAICEMRGAVALQRFEGWAAVMFWFLVAGLPGAIAYRVLERNVDATEHSVFAKALHLLDFIPVRIMALCFALTGNFVASFAQLKQALGEFSMPAASVLSSTSWAALTGYDEIASDVLERVDDQTMCQQALNTLNDLDELLGRTEIVLVVLAGAIFLL